MKIHRPVYLDNAATTQPDPAVIKRITDVFESNWGNTTGLHQHARKASELLDSMRERTARLLHSAFSEIYFTSSATESNNLALKGLLFHPGNCKKHVIVTETEHASVYNTVPFLQQYGFHVTIIKVDGRGYVHPDAISSAFREDTALVCTHFVNNEIGTIQDVAEIGNRCHVKEIPFFVDAVQAVGKIAIDLKTLPIDLLSASSHKIHGPPGTGLLYVRSGLKLEPQLHGGGQEQGLRPSTVNLPTITGFVEALERAMMRREEEQERFKILRKKILKNLENIPENRVNGDKEQGIGNIINVSFKDTDGDLLAMHLDKHGFSVSTGASCSAGTISLSRIITACGISQSWAKGTIRISFGMFTDEEEIDGFIHQLPVSVTEVRKIS